MGRFALELDSSGTCEVSPNISQPSSKAGSVKALNEPEILEKLEANYKNVLEWSPIGTENRLEGLGIEKPSPDADSKAEIFKKIIQLLPKKSENPYRQTTFLLKSMWEGTVASITSDSFWARITPGRNEPKSADKDVEFLLEDVNEGDRSLVKPGAPFYWYIGYRISPTGNRSRSSELYFRRILRTSRDKKREDEMVERWKNAFGTAE